MRPYPPSLSYKGRLKFERPSMSVKATIPPAASSVGQVRYLKPFRQRLGEALSSYTARVLLQGLFTVFAVMTFTFFLVRLMPGNPVDIKIDQLMQAQGLTYEQARSQAAGLFDMDLNAPVGEQYLTYVSRVLRGDLGKSILSAGTPVADIIWRFLPWTLFSVGLGLLVSFALGVLLGAAMAYWRGGILDNVMTAIASILYSIPEYIIALLIILVAGVQLQLFQVGELRGGFNPDVDPGFTLEFIGSILKHAALPVITYVLATIGGWILAMKSSTISTLGEDYITVAKARGLSERRVLTAYVGRNALLPLVTRLSVSIGLVVGGSVIVEELFQYPGLGRQLLRAIYGRDYTVMQGIFLITSISVVASTIIADLMLGWLDPRVRVGQKSSKG